VSYGTYNPVHYPLWNHSSFRTRRCRDPSVLTQIPMPDWTRIGGWSSPGAKVVFSRATEGFALALVDTNGDGRQLCLDKAEQTADGSWQITSTDDDVTNAGGEGWTTRFVYAWGDGRPGQTIIVDYRNNQHSVVVESDGWWVFLAPTDPAAGDGITPLRLQ
jgi:hypothetical protein